MMKPIFTAILLSLLAGCAAQDGPATIDTPDMTTTLDDKNSAEPAPDKTVRIASEIATPDERASCEAAGGEVMRAGLRGWENCVVPYEDAGKACMDSSECTGNCYVMGEYPGIGEATKAGQCQPNSNPFGCRTEVIDGKADATLCVD